MFDPLVLVAQEGGASAVSVPTQWLVYAGLAVAALFWLRSQNSNPSLDTVRRLLGALLNWPEVDTLDHVHEDPLSRVSCAQELAAWLKEHKHAAEAAQIVAMIPVLLEEE